MAPNTRDEDSRKIFLRNYTGRDQNDLRVILDVYDINGTLRHHAEHTVNIATDTSIEVLDLPALEGASDIRFIQTTVYHGSALISDNFYWMNAAFSQDYRELNTLPRIELTKTVRQIADAEDGSPRYEVTITNPTDTPALLIRLKTLDNATGEQLLPVYYDDNYISLMPGRSKAVKLDIDGRFSDRTPCFELEGWNVISRS